MSAESQEALHQAPLKGVSRHYEECAPEANRFTVDPEQTPDTIFFSSFHTALRVYCRLF